MFLTSDAFRAFDSRLAGTFNWTRASILLVSYDWDARNGSAEALAGQRLVDALLAAGASVHVLAGTPVREGGDARAERVTWVPRASFSNSRYGRALEMIRSTVPEATGPWVEPAVRKGCRVLSELPPETVIYGRAMPGTSNIVAWHLARATERPFVAHFSDEWPPVHVLSANRKVLAPYKWPLFAWWRRRILNDAGALTFTNPMQGADVLGRWHARQARRAFVVPHLPSRRVGPHGMPEPGVFHIVHTGNLYAQDQPSKTLMHGLRLFIDRLPASDAIVKFTQAGWSNGDMPEWTRRLGLEHVVRFPGRLSQEGVFQLLDAAHLLVGIDYRRPCSTTLLSKTPDYLHAARPVLVITSPSSAMGRLFNDDGAGLTARHDSPEGVARRISEVFDAWRNGSVDAYLPSPAAIESFSSPRVLGELAAAFSTARAETQGHQRLASGRRWRRERATL